MNTELGKMNSSTEVNSSKSDLSRFFCGNALEIKAGVASVYMFQCGEIIMYSKVSHSVASNTRDLSIYELLALRGVW